MAKTAAGKKLVIVESPTKAKTIRKFLGKNYVVESCMGHIRDLPQSARDIPKEIKKQPWAALGVNVDEDFEPVYLIPKNKTKVVSELKALAKDASEIYLATDEDREGESISWHLLEVLKPKVPVKRMVFHEITQAAITQSLEDTRKIDDNLVRAQEARRILDRLVGYTISPLLWKKVAFGLSAGRVQSVAVRLICEREFDRIKFKKSQYWGVSALCKKGTDFETRLISREGKKIATGKDFDPFTGELFKEKRAEILHLDETLSSQIASEIKNAPWTVTEVEEKPVNRKPAPPFITSTLQQEASRKLGMSAREAMRTAQSLYEQGFITYMRTDSTFLSTQAIQAARKSIQGLYGKEYMPEEPRVYTGKKVKGAQEAHEAIRPAGTDFILPEKSGLSGDQLKLYDLIWKRTVASQMADSRQKQVSVRLGVGKNIFAANGNSIEFAGFLRAYVEGQDDPEAALEEREVILPLLKKNDKVDFKSSEATSHETKPPARYTEASLIQTLEKEGIGRPSTYAPTIGTIIDRGYVQRQSSSALAPTFTAMIVNKLLSEYLSQYVDLGFTSEMEKSLDDIASGDLDYLSYLKSIYHGKSGLKSQVAAQEKKIDPETARAIELQDLKGLSFRVGRYGAYVCRKEKNEDVCASLPESQAPADITLELAHKLIDQKVNGADALGKDPNTGKPIYVLTGRYGPYVQLGDSTKEGEKPKRVSVPATMKMEEVTLKQALDLISLPRLLGQHPETAKDIKAGLGRFGPYIVHDGDFRSIPKTESLFEIELKRALELLAQPKKGRGKQTPLKELGEHPKDKEKILLFNGKYGPYIKWGKTNASLPQDADPEKFSLEAALALLKSKEGGAEGDEKPAKSAKSPRASKKVEASPKIVAAKKAASAGKGAKKDPVKALEPTKKAGKPPGKNPQKDEKTQKSRAFRKSH